jgi:uncharacterized protein YecE (DUF72 family)
VGAEVIDLLGKAGVALCLESDAAELRGRLADGLDVYVYFNNDRGGAAVRNALRFRQLLGQEARALVNFTR